MPQEKEKQILREKKAQCKDQQGPEEELLSFILGTGMPCQPLLVEGNDDLRAADVGFTSWDQVCLIGSFPFKRKKEEKKKLTFETTQ